MESVSQRRYAAVAKDLIDQIGSGHYPVGSLLPMDERTSDL